MCDSFQSASRRAPSQASFCWIFLQRNERPALTSTVPTLLRKPGILEPCNTQPFGTLCPSGWLPESSAATVHETACDYVKADRGAGAYAAALEDQHPAAAGCCAGTWLPAAAVAACAVLRTAFSCVGPLMPEQINRHLHISVAWPSAGGRPSADACLTLSTSYAGIFHPRGVGLAEGSTSSVSACIWPSAWLISAAAVPDSVSLKFDADGSQRAWRLLKEMATRQCHQLGDWLPAAASLVWRLSSSVKAITHFQGHGSAGRD
jgi:hypothetical protein